MRKLHNFLKNLPVSRKLMAALFVLLITIIVISNLAFITASYWITLQSMAPQGLRTLGNLYATPTLSHQLLNSTDTANEALGQMVNYMPLRGAAIYGTDGMLLAEFPHKDAPDFPKNIALLDNWMTSQFGTNYITDLESDDGQFGRLVLLASNKLPIAFFIGISSASLGILVLSILLWLILAKQIRGHISNPIKELETLALRVTREENYALRVIPHSRDEIGQLATAFNTMLSRIEAREQLLKTARDEAEALATEMRETNVQLVKEMQVRNKVEKKLTSFQSYLNNIINSMPSALIAVDKELYVTQWNQEATSISGSSLEEAVDQPLFLAFPHLKPYMEQLKLCIESNQIEKVEKVSWIQEGLVRHYALTFYPLVGENVHGGVIRIDDITERLNLQELMVQSEKMLSVGGLAAGMAHEINNPLGAILHNTQNIRRRLSVNLSKNKEIALQAKISLQEVNKYLEMREIPQLLDAINQAGSRASKIVTHMLAFSRRSKRQFTPANLADIIRQTLEIAKNDLQLGDAQDIKNIVIKLDLNETLGKIPIVVNEIEQVLFNLLKNASQAILMRTNPSETGFIQIRLLKRQQWAVIEVEDNGIGMTEITTKRIFEPFFTTKEVGKGTGLGLFVSYFIITNNHKGELSVNSKVGRGTCFCIKLPINNTSGKN